MVDLGSVRVDSSYLWRTYRTYGGLSGLTWAYVDLMADFFLWSAQSVLAVR